MTALPSLDERRPFFPIRILWWLFVLVITGAPLLLAAVGPSGQGWHNTVERGELLLVSSALTAASGAGAARLSTTGNRQFWRHTVIVASFLVCFLAGLSYADARHAIADAVGAEARAHVRTTVEMWSWALLAAAVVFGIGAEYLSHVEAVTGGRWRDE